MDFSLKDRIYATKHMEEASIETVFRNQLAIMQALERIRYVGPICSKCEDKGETTTPHCISCGNLQEQQ